jgi:hypothetical protein
MTGPLLDLTVFIEVARPTSLVAGIRASIVRIAKDMVEGGVGVGRRSESVLEAHLGESPLFKHQMIATELSSEFSAKGRIPVEFLNFAIVD